MMAMIPRTRRPQDSEAATDRQDPESDPRDRRPVEELVGVAAQEHRIGLGIHSQHQERHCTELDESESTVKSPVGEEQSCRDPEDDEDGEPYGNTKIIDGPRLDDMRRGTADELGPWSGRPENERAHSGEHHERRGETSLHETPPMARAMEVRNIIRAPLLLQRRHPGVEGRRRAAARSAGRSTARR